MTDFNNQIIAEFRANSGVVTSEGFGNALVLLHHIGVKTGREWVTPLAALPDGDAWIVIGSPARAPKEPKWVGNLRANANVRIEAGTETIPVTARELHGDEWQTAWDAFTRRMAAFGDPAGIDWTWPTFSLERRT